MKTPVLVTALVLALAFGGSAGYAAGSLPKNSVGAKQLKKGAVKSKAVADGSLTAADFAPGTLPAPIAPNSLTGAQIDESTLATAPGQVVLTGAEFAPNSSTTSYSALVGQGRFVNADTTLFAQVHLPPGTRMTGVTLFYGDQGGNVVDGRAVRITPRTLAETRGAVSSSQGQEVGVRTLALAPPPGQPGPEDTWYVSVFLPATTAYGVFGAVVTYA